MAIEVRTVTEAEVPAWCAAMNTGFLNPSGDLDAQARRPALHLDRTWGAFESAGDGGERVVATLRSFPTELTVPGGTLVPVSAMTAVATVSTHRRRGLASRLVAADLATSKERGDPASVLIAAEWPIYGRFGYGAATEHQTVVVNTVGARLRQRPAGSVQYVDEVTGRAVVPRIYQRYRVGRPGEIARPDRMWDLAFGVVRYPSWPEPKRCFTVLASDAAGNPVGLARYEVEEKWDGRVPAWHVAVTMLVTAEPAGDALLWDHLVNLDLAASIRAGDRPVDELLPWLLADARYARAIERADFLWVRPLDIAALLAARSYLVPGRLVLQVRDADGLAGGRFALDAGPDGVACGPSAEAADLTLDVAAVGSAYLGGFTVRTLAAAGLVDEESAGAVAKADAMFRSPVTPWCSTWF